MTITNFLLVLILLAILARIWQAHTEGRRLRELIDAFADMTGDFLRGIFDNLNKPK